MDITAEQRKKARSKIASLRSRCKEKNLEFHISIDDMIKFQAITHCQLTGVKLKSGLNQSKQPYNCRTLDRIDSKIGYISSNIMVICHYANRLKARFEDTTNPQHNNYKNYTSDYLIAHVKKLAIEQMSKQNILITE